MTESRSYSKAEKSEEHKDFSFSISEDRILPFELPFFSSRELDSYLVGTLIQMLVSPLDRILWKTLAPGMVVLL